MTSFMLQQNLQYTFVDLPGQYQLYLQAIV